MRPATLRQHFRLHRWKALQSARDTQSDGEPLGLVFTAEQALAAILEMAPELSSYPLIAVRSANAPPWSTYERA